MIYSVYLPLLVPLLAVPLVRWVAVRLHPALASWLVVACALVLAGCATLALGLLMFAALADLHDVARLGHWSPAILRQLDAVHLPIDIGATTLLLGLVVNALVAGIRRGRALVAAYRMSGDGGDELMVVEDVRPLAHALPGRPGRIVVSTSMLAILEPTERRALLAHERAHLAHRHHVFVAGVDLLAAMLPLLRPLTSVIRYTTERWADEAAAGQVGDRAVVARAVGKAALAAKTYPTGGVAMAATAGPVPRRVAALLAARTRPLVIGLTALSALLACGLVFGSVFFSLDALTDLHRVVELAQHNGYLPSPRAHRHIG